MRTSWLRRSCLAVVLAALAVAGLLLPPSAVAAPADEVWAGVQVTLDMSPKGVPTMLIMGELNATARLPAEVALAVPAGKTITWAGEVFPSGNGQDTKVAYRVEKNAAPGWDRILFKMTKSRDAQVEVAVPGAITVQGTKELAKVTWTTLGGVGKVQMAIDMPAGSKVDTGTPGGGVVQSDRGPVYAAVSSGGVRARVELSLRVLYTRGAGGTTARGAVAPSRPGSGSGPWLAVVVFLILLLGYLVVSRRMAPEDGKAEGVEERRPDDRE